jgi:peptidoglycan/LPS O-acetylase OafA/YrhL
VLYYANLHLISEGGSYATRFGERSPLQHTWSLALEEQFYALWPLIVLALGYKVAGPVLRRRLIVATALGIGASATMLLVRYDGLRDPLRVYYGSDTRVHALLMGALLAAVVNARPRLVGLAPWAQRSVVAGGCAALVLMAFAMRTLDYFAPFLYRGGFVALSALGALIVVAAAQTGPNPLRRVLEWKPLRLLGLVSYGVYLWHWPALVMLNEQRVGLSGVPLLALQLAATAFMTTVSYLVVERPIRRSSLNLTRTLGGVVLVGAVLMVAVIGATALPDPVSAGANHRSVPPSAASVGGAGVASAAPTSIGPSTSLPSATAPPGTSSEGESAAAAAAPVPAPTTTVAAVAPRPRKVMLVGDSVAWTLGGGVLSFPQPDTYVSPFPADRITLWNLARYGCGITPGTARVGRVERPPLGTCAEWEKNWAGAVEQFAPDLVVFSEALWETYDHRVEGKIVPFGSPEGDALYLATLERLRVAVTGRGARLVLLSAPMYLSTEGEFGAERGDYWRYQHLNALQSGFAASHPGNVSAVDLGSYVCTDVVCHEPLPSGAKLRGDGVHFSPEAAAWIAPWLTAQLDALPAAVR